MNAVAHKVEPAEVYRVTSGRSGRIYYVDPDVGRCTCEAGQKGILCSHVRAAEAHALKALEAK